MSAPTISDLVDELREHAAEAVGHIGEPGMWPDALREESRAFERVADFIAGRYVPVAADTKEDA
jgi:hypothetical protein